MTASPSTHASSPHALSPARPPPGGRWGEGAQSVLEQLLQDRTAKPDAFSEEHPSA